VPRAIVRRNGQEGREEEPHVAGVTDPQAARHPRAGLNEPIGRYPERGERHMFKIMFALQAMLSFVISEAEARSEAQPKCVKVLNPERPLDIQNCENDGKCYWRHFDNVMQVGVLGTTPKGTWVHVRENPPSYSSGPWEGWMHVSRKGKPTYCKSS